jgi:hypothetical protein
MKNQTDAVQIVVTLWLAPDANVQEVVSEMDYNFTHDAVLDCEISELLTPEGLK